LADRLHRSIGRLQVPAAAGSERVGCTASIGVSASFDRFDGWEPAASQADEALYRVKTAGRDGVQSHLAACGT
jgi:PleD family two-component response regulator